MRVRRSPDWSIRLLLSGGLFTRLDVECIAYLVGERGAPHDNYRNSSVKGGFDVSHRRLLIVSDHNCQHFTRRSERSPHATDPALGNPLSKLILASTLLTPLKLICCCTTFIAPNQEEVSVAIRQLVSLPILYLRVADLGLRADSQ